MEASDPDRDASARDRRRALRSAARSARRGVAPHVRADAQVSIIGRLLGLDEIVRSDPSRRPRRIGLYHPTDGEADLRAAATTLRALGWTVLLPVIRDDTTMAFARWSEGQPLIPNRHGIAEPDDTDELSDAGSLDVVVVPCVAVDPAGHRLGFGAGYYDRALAGADRTLRVGIAFEVQVMAHLEPAPWDVPLDVVVTEAQVIRPGADDPG